MPPDTSRALAGEPLRTAELREAVVVPGGLWTDVRVVTETGSTNEDVLSLASGGAPEGLVIAAEAQTAGRGRLGRSWQSLPGAALTFSVLLRPAPVPQSMRGWLPLLTGVAVASALREATGAGARLKWPNDILVDGRKLAGILAEQAGEAIVVGIGLNVLGDSQVLPVATATSLERHGAAGTSRTELLALLLRHLANWYQRWRAGAGDPDLSGIRPRYRELCDTLGRTVHVRLPGDRLLAGIAVDVDGAGLLLVRQQNAEVVAISAGEVIHVR